MIIMAVIVVKKYPHMLKDLIALATRLLGRGKNMVEAGLGSTRDTITNLFSKGTGALRGMAAKLMTAIGGGGGAGGGNAPD